jgi:hypothetical protein
VSVEWWQALPAQLAVGFVSGIAATLCVEWWLARRRRRRRPSESAVTWSYSATGDLDVQAHIASSEIDRSVSLPDLIAAFNRSTTPQNESPEAETTEQPRKGDEE